MARTSNKRTSRRRRRRSARRRALWLALGATVVAIGAVLGSVFLSAERVDPQLHLDKARQWLADGDGNAALLELRTALQADPDFIEARRELALLYLRAGQGAPAEEEVKRLRALGLVDPEFETMELRALLLQGEFATVVGRLSTREGPSDVEEYRLLAAAYLGLGDRDGARRSYEGALEAAPEDARARLGLAEIEFAQSDFDGAKMHVEKLLARDEPYAPASRLAGQIALAEQRYADAQQIYTDVLTSDANSMAALYGLTQAQLGLEDLSAAKATLKRLISAFPAAPQRWVAEAAVSKASEDDPRAIAALREILRLAPNHVPSLMELGELLARAGAGEQAVEVLRRAVQHAPDSQRARLLLAGALADAGNRGEAVTALRGIQASGDDDPRIHALLGHLQLQSGDRDEGLESLQRAAAIGGEVPRLQTWLGSGYMLAGQVDQAIDALKAAADKDPSVRNLAMLSLAYARHGDMDNAMSQARRAQTVNAGNPLGHFVAGILLSRSGDQDGAEASFQQALAVDPHHLWTNVMQAQALYAAGKAAPAISKLEALREHHPASRPLAIQLGRMYLQSRRSSEALALLQAQPEGPGSSAVSFLLAQALLLEGRLEDALARINRAEQDAPGQGAIAMVKARIQQVTRDWAGAEKTIRTQIERTPDVRPLVLQLGQIQLHSGAAEAAVETFAGWAQAHPEDLGAKLLLARAKLATGDLVGARTMAKELRKAVPQAAHPIALAGTVSMAEGRYERALAEFRTAHAMAPTAQLVLAQAQALRGLERSDEARSMLTAWLEEHPNDATVQRALGEVALRANEVDSALSQYDAILAKNPNDVIALNNAAWLLLDGEPQRALALAERAYALLPTHGAVLDTYGWVLANTGHPEQGIKHLQRAAELASNEPGHRYRLAFAYAEANETIKARRILDEILTSKSEFPERADAASLLERLAKR